MSTPTRPLQAPAPAAATPTLDAATTLGPVRLTVSDLKRQQRFYQRAIGLRTLASGETEATLGTEPGAPLVELIANPSATTPPPGATGLFHLAILVPDRPRLARALRRVVDAGWRLTGASDHLVSEALYLDDPESNGIEIYRDRPREQWRYVDGQLAMDTLALDVDSLIAELPAGDDDGIGSGTRIGHVHLRVADIAAAEAFYAGVLGFDVTVRGYSGALFVSAGGYHHHIGLNTWHSRGGSPPPASSRGLERYEIVLPDAASLAAVTARLAAASIPTEQRDGQVLASDPSGNRLALVTAG